MACIINVAAVTSSASPSPDDRPAAHQLRCSAAELACPHPSFSLVTHKPFWRCIAEGAHRGRPRLATTFRAAAGDGAGDFNDEDDDEAGGEDGRKAASLRVQRDLARRLVAAQTRWLEPPTRNNQPPRSTSRASTGKRSEAFGSEDAAGPFEEDTPGGAGTIGQEAYSRGQWLLGLLVLQSSSSVVLQRYEDLVRDNIVITLFLTMLVGAGGNAGNQSAIRVIRGLATGELEVTYPCMVRTLWQQTRVGLLLSTALSVGGFVRVLATQTGDGAGEAPGAFVGALGIALSLFAIVTVSTFAGTVLPFALAAGGQDPANAGTTVQVCMDISGVLITCAVCSFVFAHVESLGGWGGVAAVMHMT